MALQHTMEQELYETTGSGGRDDCEPIIKTVETDIETEGFAVALATGIFSILLKDYSLSMPLFLCKLK